MTDKELLEAFGQDVYVSCPKDFALNSIVLPGEFKLRRYDSKQQYQAETVIGLPTLMILIIDGAIHSIGKCSYEELLYAEKHNVPVIAWFKDLASIEDWCYTSKDVTTRDIIDNGKNWNKYCQLGASDKNSLISKLKTFPVPAPKIGGGQWYYYVDVNMCYQYIFKMHSESLYTERVRCKDSDHWKDRGYISKKQIGAKCTEEELLRFLPKDHPDRPTVPVTTEVVELIHGEWYQVVDRPEFFFKYKHVDKHNIIRGTCYIRGERFIDTDNSTWGDKEHTFRKANMDIVSKHLPEGHKDIVHVNELEDSTKLEEFPAEGCCKTGWDDLIRYVASLEARLEELRRRYYY